MVPPASITSRHYYEREQCINNDRLHHIPIDIENLQSVPPRRPPNDADIAAGIRRVATFVKGNVGAMIMSQVSEYQQKQEVQKLIAPPPRSLPTVGAGRARRPNAARSTLPLAFRGSASSTVNAAGIM